MPLTRDDLGGLLGFAVTVAELGGKTTLDYFQSSLTIEVKPDSTVVTEADRESERVMRHAISARHPSDGILGEELGETAAQGPFRWILDPIDGTLAFVSGSPLYGVIVGLQHEEEFVLGVIHMPALGETLAAARGVGCFWNDRRCCVSSVARVSEALVLVTDDRAMRRELPGYANLADEARLVRTWGDCYGAVMVATGRAEVFIDGGLDVTDIGALLPIVEEAGGVLTDWSGRRNPFGETVLATNGRLHAATLKLLGQ